MTYQPIKKYTLAKFEGDYCKAENALIAESLIEYDKILIDMFNSRKELYNEFKESEEGHSK